MDMYTNTVKWFRDMGYNGRLPDNLVCVCNNASKHVWEQVTETIHPKLDVDCVKGNIILNRLRNNPSEEQNIFTEIDKMAKQRKSIRLKKRIERMMEKIAINQFKAEQKAELCSMKNVTLQSLNKRVCENEERHFILHQKRTQLEVQHVEGTETLQKLKNVTPVERDDSATTKEITDTLKKCAEKLNQLIMESQKIMLKQMPRDTIYSSTKKNAHLSNQDKLLYESIIRDHRERMEDKENTCISELNGPPIRMKLFSNPQIIIEDIEKSGFEKVELNQIPVSKKRESLGLLPESYLNELDKDDSFLVPLSRMESDFSENSVLANSTASTISVNSSNFKVPERMNKKSNTSKNLYSNAFVNKELEQLLHKNSREVVHDLILGLIHHEEIEFTKLVCVENESKERKRSNDDDISKLCYTHVKTELCIVTQKRTMKDLVTQIKRKKMHILSAFASMKNFVEIRESLEKILKETATEAQISVINTEKDSFALTENDVLDINDLSVKITKTKSDIALKMNLIHSTLDELASTARLITSNRESVLNFIWHLRMFRSDTDWTNALLECLWFKEMSAFSNFPLEFQRRCIHTNGRSSYKDFSIHTENSQLGNEEMEMLCAILQGPFNLPDIVMLKLIKEKRKMKALESMRNKNVSDSCDVQRRHTHSLENLRQRESYIDFAIDRLKTLMFSSTAAKTLSVDKVVKEAMEIWLAIPMKDFICGKRLVDNQNYEYYANKIHAFL